MLRKISLWGLGWGLDFKKFVGRKRIPIKRKQYLLLFSFLIVACREEKNTDKKERNYISIFVLEIWYLAVGRKRTLTKRKETIFLSSFLKFGCREEKDIDKKEETFASTFVFGCREKMGTDKNY